MNKNFKKKRIKRYRDILEYVGDFCYLVYGYDFISIGRCKNILI